MIFISAGIRSRDKYEIKDALKDLCLCPENRGLTDNALVDLFLQRYVLSYFLCALTIPAAYVRTSSLPCENL